MFDRPRLGALLASITLALPALAQSSDRAVQQRRAVDIAARTYVAAADAYDQRRDARLRLPVVRTYAGLQVRADTTFVQREFLVRLDSGFARARQEAAGAFGVTTDSLLAGAQVILTQSTSSRTRFGVSTPSQSIHAEGLRSPSMAWSSSYHNAGWRTTEPIDQIKSYFIMWFEYAAGAQLPPSIAAWMGTHTHVREWDVRWREPEHFGLVMHPSGIGLACANGAITACRIAFALVPNADTIGAWFDAASRRARVVRALEMRNVRAMVLRTHAEAADRCTEIGEDAACRAVLARVGVQSPTSRVSRQHLVRLALQRGGEHAFERLRADSTDSVERAIASAAGVPVDSLLAPWREMILAGRPPSPAPNGREVFLGVALLGSLVGLTVARKP
ncbi:MAG TPA: hypothetical protein VJR92_07690 [Gemmatimonadaceae bacterium]|nr:hypothetical protein [Gemmatimonadaceae bacterium]